MKKSWMKIILIACAGLFAANLAFADEPPSGTVSIKSKSIAVGVGVTWGKGNLSFQGGNYGFKVDGLTVIDLGISKISSSGEVFYLRDLNDFSGNYVAAASGVAIAGGVDDVIMKNDHGVVLRLRGVEKGVRLQLGAQGVTVTLRKDSESD